MTRRPRLGVLFVTSGWFHQVGLQADGSSLSADVETTAAAVIARLSHTLDLTYPGIVSSEAQARKSAEVLRAADLDGILVSPLMWCEDQILRAVLDALPPLPMVVWVFLPSPCLGAFLEFERMLSFSGPVGALQASGMLKREAREYRAVVGHHQTS